MSKAITYRDLIAECEADSRCYVDVTREGEVATVTMNNPSRLNALTPALCYQLHQALRDTAADPDLRVVILTGSDPAFCAGGDLQLILRGGEAIRAGGDGAVTLWRWIRYQFGGIARLLSQSDTYFIAAINGPAAGVGLSFSFACDYQLASTRAELVLAFGKIGLVPEVGSNWHLTRRLGYHKAMALFVAGGRLSADDAHGLGLVNDVVAHEALLATARQWAQRVLALPENVTAMTKAQMRKVADMSWEQAITMEEFAEPICFSTDPHRAAVEALLARS